MAYAVLQDLINRFGMAEMTGLTDSTGSGQPDAEVIGLALDDATQQIDSYLAGRYQLPLNPVPAPATRWCCHIARFYLYKNEVPDVVKTNYSTSITELKLAQAGSLTLEAVAVPTATNTDAVELAGPDRLFTSNNLRRF